MKIGILKEIKPAENRVILVPDDVEKLVQAGHEVFVENGAGQYSSFMDAEYEAAGAVILPTSEKVFKTAELLLKVLPPMPIEYELFTEQHISFSYLFLPSNPELLKALLKYNSIFFAMEMFRNNKNKHPVLKSMSKLAGKMAIFEAAKYLQRTYGGKGILLGRTENTPAARVTILGAGTAGKAAANQALRLGADVNLIDIDPEQLEKFENPNPRAELVLFEFSRGMLQEVLLDTDVLITAAQVPGQKAPTLVTNSDIKLMQQGSIIIDLAIDQGGCVESSRPTSPENPVFNHEGILHHCVSNLPSAIPNTASTMISAAAMAYVTQIAQLGGDESIALLPDIRSGLVIYHRKIVNELLAASNNMEYYEVREMLELSL